MGCGSGGARSGLGLIGGGLAGGATAGSNPVEQQFMQMLDKVCETIERNELRLLAQDRRDAVRLEWQQVT